MYMRGETVIALDFRSRPLVALRAGLENTEPNTSVNDQPTTDS
jgi:hypothetical protein